MDGTIAAAVTIEIQGQDWNAHMTSERNKTQKLPL